MKINELIKRLFFGRKNLLAEFYNWLKIIFSFGAWAFFPVILAVFFGYWCHSKGFSQEKVKYYCEFIAIILMSLTFLVFLLRVVLYKLKLDIVLLLLSFGFLCREIHFIGTDEGVVVVAVFAGIVAWFWRDDILESLADKKQLKAMIFCMCWSYLVALLIQKRVFKPHRLPFLPSENLVSVSLEEITENVAHMAFMAIGIMSFFYSNWKIKNKDKGSVEN